MYLTPIGYYRKGRSQRHRQGPPFWLSNPSDRSRRSSAGCPHFPSPFPSPVDFPGPLHSTVPVPPCPRNKKRRILRRRPARRSRWSGGGAGGRDGGDRGGVGDGLPPVRIGRHGLRLCRGWPLLASRRVSFNAARCFGAGWLNLLSVSAIPFLIGQ